MMDFQTMIELVEKFSAYITMFAVLGWGGLPVVWGHALNQIEAFVNADFDKHQQETEKRALRCVKAESANRVWREASEKRQLEFIGYLKRLRFWGKRKK